jgi:hypothetical protein
MDPKIENHADSCNSSTHIEEVFSVRGIKLRGTVGLTMMVPLQINGTKTGAVVDTAAQITMINPELLAELNIVPDPGSQIKINNAQKGSGMMGQILKGINLTLGSKTYKWDVIVAPITDKCILGLDFLKAHNCSLDLEDNSLRIGNKLVAASLIRNTSGTECRVSKVVLERRTKIPPNSIKIITGRFTDPADTDFVVQPVCTCQGHFMAASLVKGGNGQAPLVVVNDSHHFVTLKRGYHIANAVELDAVIDHLDDATLATLGSLSIPSLSVRSSSLAPEDENSLKLKEELTKVSGKLPEHVRDLYNRSVSGLFVWQSIQVAHLLIEFDDVFSKHELDLGHFTEIQHRINTRDAKPIKSRSRRTPLNFRQEEEKTLQGMLEAGVVGESNSDWSAAPVLVRKRDGKVRYCVDFRPLNNVTVKDAFPLPLIEECLDTLSGTEYFSTLDMASGYWQISIAPEDRHKTAFCTKYGLYEHIRMGFGLCNAPATFQRAMNLVLRGMTWKEVMAYLDDVIVLGKGFEDMLENLRNTLLRFRKYHLKLKPRKCTLFRPEVDFLGRTVDRNGVRVTDAKIQAVLDWPVPSSTKELESFLGYINYHRDFIKGLAGIATPLYAMTGPRAEFLWEERHQVAFDKLKKAMVSPPVLAFPDPEGRFILDTDASDTAVGAELSQIQNGCERPIAYASNSLTPEQRRKCTTSKELLAVVTFTRVFRHYLLGRRFTVRTDHSSLVWLMRFKNIGGQLARWLEELSQFDMEIEHRSGVKHSNADGLSRIPDRLTPCNCYEAGRELDSLPCNGCVACTRAHKQWSRFETDVDDVIPLAIRELTVEEQEEQQDREAQAIASNYIQTRTPAELRDLQLKDPDLRPLFTWLESDADPTEGDRFLQSAATRNMWLCKSQLKVKNGVLYYLWDYGTYTRLKLVVPDPLQQEILSLVHDTKPGGHFGRDITLEKLKRSFYWYRMRLDCKVFTGTCDTCSKQKKATRKARAGLVNYRAGEPGDRVHLDIFGPLVRSARGNKYGLVGVDQFSKWVEIWALSEQTAETIAETFFDQWVTRYGVPIQIHTDQGKNFDGNFFKSFCTLLEVVKTRTTPYRPSSNGQVERYNRVILQFIRCFLEGKQKNWDKYVSVLGMALRASVNRSTGFTANMLHLGREVNMPSDLLFGVAEANQEEREPVEFLKEVLETSKKVFAKVRDSLRTSQERQKRTYDVKMHQRSYDKGDLVYKLDTSTRKGQSKKLRPIWLGPYVVTEVLSPVLYCIEGRKAKHTVHHDRIKICRDRVVPMWMRRKRHGLLDLDETIAYAIEELESSIAVPVDSDTDTQTPAVPANVQNQMQIPASNSQTLSQIPALDEAIVAFANARDEDLPAFTPEDNPEDQEPLEEEEEDEVQEPVRTRTRVIRKRVKLDL